MKKFIRFIFALMIGIFVLIYSEPLGITGQFNETKKENFDVDFIISDEVFTNVNSMTIEQIQAFLESKNSPLADKELYQKYYLAYPTDSEIYNLVFPNGKLARESSPAEIIYYSGQIKIFSESKPNQINPQILLVLLEFNQGLIENPENLDQLTLDNALKFTPIEIKKPFIHYQGFLNQLIVLASKLTEDLEYFKNALEENKPTTIIDRIIRYPKNAGTFALQKFLELSKRLVRFNNFIFSFFSNYQTAPSFRYPMPINEYIIWQPFYPGSSYPNYPNHLGEDTSKYEGYLPSGYPIRAIGNGKIVWYRFATGYASWEDDISICAVIEHNLGRDIELDLKIGDTKKVAVNKICSIYGHIRKSKEYYGNKLNLKYGDYVRKGQIIGYINDDEHNGERKEHLHLGIRLTEHPGYWVWVYYGKEDSTIPESNVKYFAAASEVIEKLSCKFFPSDSLVRWHPDGILIRASGQFEVYLIHNGKKKHITNGDFLNKYYYGFDWNNVIEVVPEELACYPTGEDIVHQPSVVRVSGTAPVYLTFNETYKRHFNKEDVFEGLGYDWNEIIDISQSELTNYLDDPVCPELYSPYPDGTLIKKYGDTNVYVITNGKKRLIENDTVFNMLGYNWNCIVEDTNSAVDNIPEITPPIDYNMITNCGGRNPALKISTNSSGPWLDSVSGEQGTTFYFLGTGFSPNSTATQHIQYPDETDHTYNISVDSNGELSWSYESNCDTPTGIYTIWVVDTTGQSSNEVSETIERSSTCNNPPQTPSTPSGPSDGYVGTSYSFSTSATDPDGDAINYRFDWGDGNISTWGSLTQNHSWSLSNTYSIKAQAKDSFGATSSWSSGKTITISACIPPSTPSNPYPSDGVTGVPIDTNLDWDDCTGATSYDVYFGTTSYPPKVVTVTSSSYAPGTLTYNMSYYWKIIAKNSCGETSGPLWDFTTKAGAVQHLWARTYGGSEGEQAESIQQTSDGGYILAGHTQSFGSGGLDFWVLKLSANGEIEWEKTYGGIGSDYAYSIQQTNNGGYIVAGATNSFGAGGMDFWILKLFSNGEIEWQHTYGGSSEDIAYSINQTDDGCYIVAGSKESHCWILKLSSTGDVEWQKTYGGKCFGGANSIQQTNDGGYIVTASTSTFFSNANFWLLKLFPNGEIEWQRVYGGDGNDYAYSIQQTKDGGYIVAGVTGSFGVARLDFWILKLMSNGDIEWQRTYGGDGNYYDWPYSIQQTNDEGYIVAGYTSYHKNILLEDLWVLKIYSTGEIKWQRTYDINTYDRAYSIQQTNDRGFVVAGTTRPFGSNPPNSDLLILKLSSDGDIYPSCGFIESSNATVSDTNVAPENTNIIPQDTNISPHNTNISPQDTDATVTILCQKSDDLLGTWHGQGVYYRNSDDGTWVKMASPADLIAAGDLDGDGIYDLIGTWSGQGGVWIKYSLTGTWSKLSSSASYIASGDMNGDGRCDFLGTWTGQGVYYRNSDDGSWVKMSSPATEITAGDIDGDGTDDLLGIWPSQGGVWVKYSSTDTWSRLSSTADWIAAGDMNGDGKDDLLGTWIGQGVYYRNSDDGSWVKMATPADLIAAGDLDGDGVDDLIGIWSGQGGVWVKYSSTGGWSKLSSAARDIAAGKMKGWGGSGGTAGFIKLLAPIGGYAEGPGEVAEFEDLSSEGPGGLNFAFQVEKNLVPKEKESIKIMKTSGPGEPGFKFVEQKNLVPQERLLEKKRKKK